MDCGHSSPGRKHPLETKAAGSPGFYPVGGAFRLGLLPGGGISDWRYICESQSTNSSNVSSCRVSAVKGSPTILTFTADNTMSSASAVITDHLLSCLNAAGVNALDMRPQLSQTSEMIQQYFYKTDHHWNPEALCSIYCVRIFAAEKSPQCSSPCLGMLHDMLVSN